jgi:formylglycine-generating enzyme required for sulfatase activity
MQKNLRVTQLIFVCCLAMIPALRAEIFLCSYSIGQLNGAKIANIGPVRAVADNVDQETTLTAYKQHVQQATGDRFSSYSDFEERRFSARQEADKFRQGLIDTAKVAGMKIETPTEGGVSKSSGGATSPVSIYAEWPFTRAEATKRQKETAVALNWDVERTLNIAGTPIKFVLIPAGEFMMGSPPDEIGRKNDETLHRVRITQPFYMSVTEFTESQCSAIEGEGPISKEHANQAFTSLYYDRVISSLLPKMQKFAPVGFVVRLPTEAEWEYAARAGRSTRFHTGEDIHGARLQNGPECKDVAQFPPNAWGLYDMIGNQSEFCIDYYNSEFYRKSAEIAIDPRNRTPIPEKLQYDFKQPSEPKPMKPVVVRGGSYLSKPEDARLATRLIAPDADHEDFMGGEKYDKTRGVRLVMSFLND